MTRRPSRLRVKLDFAGVLVGQVLASYMRESTEGQAAADRYGPDAQRSGIRRFLAEFDLPYPGLEYFDKASGRSTEGRLELQRALTDAQAGLFTVLLIFHSSRAFRNRHEAAIWKERFRHAGVTIIFVEQRLISGNPGDTMAEAVYELLDEHQSEVQGMMIASGLRSKFEKGLHNGTAPLGFRRFHGDVGDARNGELLVDDSEAATVRTLAEQYCTGRFSFASLATWANTQTDAHGQPLFRTKRGRPFSKGAVEELMRNPIYRGQVAYHPGTPEQEQRPGRHEALITAEQWETICAIRQRHTRRVGGGGGVRRTYPLSGPTVCQQCRCKYTGDTSGKGRRRMRHAPGVDCTARQSFAAPTLEAQFATLLSEAFKLPRGWRQKIAAAVIAAPAEPSNTAAERERLEGALGNLAKLFTWGDVEEADYRRQRAQLERALVELQPSAQPTTPARCAEGGRVTAGCWQALRPPRRQPRPAAGLRRAVRRRGGSRRRRYRRRASNASVSVSSSVFYTPEG